MDKLNELVELANKMGGESWCYTQSSIFSKGYITGRGGRTIVQTYNGDVPANACQFIRTADPAAILEIAKAFREMEQRAEAAEAKLAELSNQKAAGFVNAPRKAKLFYHGEGLPVDTKLFTRPAPAAAPAELAKQVYPKAVVKHYTGCEYPVIKINSLEVVIAGEREDAEELAEYINSMRPAPAAVPVDLLPDEGELERLYSIYCTPTVGSKNAIRHIRKEMLRRLEGMK